MRWLDILGMALGGIWRRQLRSALTVAGVAVGCFVLAASLSVGQGVQEAIARQLRRQDRLRRVIAWPGPGPEAARPAFDIEGDMSDERRQRLREAAKLRWRAPASASGRGIAPEQEKEIRQIPHVAEVRPALSWRGKALLDGKTVEGTVLVGSGSDEGIRPRLLAGGGEGALVSEYAAYRWGAEDERDVAAMVGRTVRLEVGQSGPGMNAMLQLLGVAKPNLDADEKAVLDKVARQLPAVLAGLDLPPKERRILLGLLRSASAGAAKPLSMDVRIAGVVRDTTRGELGPWDAGVRAVDIYLPAEQARRLFLSRPGKSDRDLPQVAVLVDEEDALGAVQARLTEMGLKTFSLAELVEQVRFNVRLVVIACTLLAAIALAVAALGIVNTLLMAVMQRTHEIGVMKALGARDGQVMALFLAEGAALGAMGGALGMLAAWLASYPGDAFARWLVAAPDPDAAGGIGLRLPGVARAGRARAGVRRHGPGGGLSRDAGGADRSGGGLARALTLAAQGRDA